jgi:RimJ/RimL family protein N-acetyltransferase
MIHLEKFEKTDYSRLIDWIDSEELMVIFSGQIFDFPITNSQLDTYLQNPNRKVYKVIISESKEIIGHAELNAINIRSKNARICRVLVANKDYRNKGLGSLTINELVRIGFNELKLHRIDLGVYDFNKQAIRCYEKCGFKNEGLLRDNMRFGETFWSSYNMSKLNTKAYKTNPTKKENI